MMYFNRQDILQAYYLYAAGDCGGQFANELNIFPRLKRLGYCADQSLCYDKLTANGKSIYKNLIK